MGTWVPGVKKPCFGRCIINNIIQISSINTAVIHDNCSSAGCTISDNCLAFTFSGDQADLKADPLLSFTFAVYSEYISALLIPLYLFHACNISVTADDMFLSPRLTDISSRKNVQIRI